MPESDVGQVSIRWARGAEDVQAALELRHEVFCREQGVPRELELDDRDGEALHLLAVSRLGGVVGTLRLLPSGGDAKIGRVAVVADWRRRGIALMMLEEAVREARRIGASRARLASQTYAAALYERAGFEVESEPFEEAGMPHVWMGLALGRP
jgi:predicted GNAT family N-acyltransferase